MIQSVSGQQSRSVQDIDQLNLELLLAERTRDPTPLVLQGNSPVDQSIRHGAVHSMPPTDAEAAENAAACRQPAHMSYPPQPLLMTTEMHSQQLTAMCQNYPALSRPLTLSTGVAPEAALDYLPLRKESIMRKDSLLPFMRHQETDAINSPILGMATPPLPPLPARAADANDLSETLHKDPNDLREFIMLELLATEDAYVTDLELLVAVFAVPLCEFAGARDMHMEAILHPLQVLFSFQHSFLRAMHRVTDAWSVAQLFLSEASGFEAYIAYCSKYHWICNILDRIEMDSAWSGFLKEVQAQITLYSDRRRLSLRDFLIKPVQRICKYPLFIKDLMKHTDSRSEPNTYAELGCALRFISGICQGIEKEQQRIELLRLRHNMLSQYCDNPQLPLALVSKLGTVILSGPLRITSQGLKASDQLRLFGCVLFKRFFIIFRLRNKSTMLVPQFWFPLHTMRLIDDDVDRNVWQLLHVKSGQRMFFGARSAQEKQLWVDRVAKHIERSLARLRARSNSKNKNTSLSVNSPRSTNHNNILYSSAIHSRTDSHTDLAASGQSNMSPAMNHPTHINMAAAGTAELLAASMSCSSVSPTDLAKSDSIAKHFEGLTSPEILLLQTHENFKQNSLPVASSKQQKKVSSTASRATSPENTVVDTVDTAMRQCGRPPIHCVSDQECNSRMCMENKDLQPIASTAGSTCRGSAASSRRSRHSRQQSIWSNKSGRSSKEITKPVSINHREQQPLDSNSQAKEKEASRSSSTNSLTGRLLSVLDHLPLVRRKHLSTSKATPPAPEANKIVSSYHSNSTMDASIMGGGGGCSFAERSYEKPDYLRSFYYQSTRSGQDNTANLLVKSSNETTGELVLVPHCV
ncbi:hypothetical protein GGI07_003920 [Coemansia sp. Benny D115]|nr:hypothetical protein GGI07_003920 [Coemansia sp. Benny D115]